ncbi:MAG: hypothetical protein JSS34_05145 [Proteobacteria bacterium]|nr:hypothetical protein [Pseudomonadota bacterium]
MKTSSSPTKTFYFKEISGPDRQQRCDFLILDGCRRALKIEFHPQHLKPV